ncbi:MAG: M28 family metallopeptidase [Candidatus Helarchaeota archaeon]
MKKEQSIREYMHFIIQDICEKIGPRPPCSAQETLCASYIRKELEKNLSTAKIEEFYCHPGSYKVQFQIPIASLLIAIVCYWIYIFFQKFFFLLIPAISFIIALCVIQTNIMRNIELIDPFFELKKSTNVYGIFKPQNTARKKILIGGHHDSNWEFPLLRKSWKLFGLMISLSIILNYLIFAIFLIKIILYYFANPFLFIIEVDLIILVFLTCLAPALIYFSFNIISNRPVMGANDNLTSIAVILAIARTLNALNLNHTEVWLVSHGCEEIGVRGSKRFSQVHYNELKDAIVINIDMIGGQNTQLRFVTAEVVFLVQLSKELAYKLARIASKLDIPHHIGRIEAFTDSFAYTQKKIKTCSIIGFPEKGVPPHYHTREDILENLQFENLWDCYRLLIEFIKRVDRNEI